MQIKDKNICFTFEQISKKKNNNKKYILYRIWKQLSKIIIIMDSLYKEVTITYKYISLLLVEASECKLIFFFLSNFSKNTLKCIYKSKSII
jgi:hypothetical protein